MKQDEINKIIARLILSTRRKSRNFSIYDIASDILYLKTSFGNLNEVAKLVGVSSGMLNQFLSVFNLPEFVLKMVKERKIDSVSIVHYLSKFKEADVISLSQLLVSRELSSQDLRILLPFRKAHPNEDILNLVEKLNSSKNIKVSVIRINKSDTEKSIIELTQVFVSEVGRENLYAIEEKNDFLDIKLLKSGESILRQKAKAKKKSLHEFIAILIG
jgi:hypothetical protein